MVNARAPAGGYAGVQPFTAIVTNGEVILGQLWPGTGKDTVYGLCR